MCVDSVESAIAAEEGGASRLELCADLEHGGTTPSAGMVRVVREHVRIPIVVMIRPRPGDFCYSDFEMEVMIRDAEEMKSFGADGLAFGVLTPESKIDVARSRVLISTARPMFLTFHRAFEECNDRFEALDQLKMLGVDRVLTSGGRRMIDDGVPEIAALVKKSEGLIEIMAGGGVTFENVTQIVSKTKVKEIHVLSAVSSENRRLPSTTNLFDTALKVVNVSKVRRMASLLRELNASDQVSGKQENP